MDLSVITNEDGDDTFDKRNIMKRKILFIAALALMATVSCNKDKPDQNTASGVSNLMDGGAWEVSYFFDNEDRTSSFEDFRLKFDTDGVVRAIDGMTAEFKGIWLITDSNVDSDGIDELKFNISFLGPDYFQDLTGDWNIIEKSKSIIKLENTHGNSDETEYLTFEK